ncbi:MAG: hypothetical protein ACPG8W_08110 [Candidatus Promineifilaceae bacterium]
MEKPDPKTVQIACASDAINLVDSYHLPHLYIDIWKENDPSELDSCRCMNEPEDWNNISFIFIFYNPRAQYFFVARNDDPTPSDPLIFYIDHDGSDIEVLGSVEKFPDEKASIGRLSDLLADIDGQARAKLNGDYYAELHLDASIDECQEALKQIAKFDMTACDQMSYQLYLAAFQVKKGDLSAAKAHYAAFLPLQNYPLRESEKEMLDEITSILTNNATSPI